MSEPENFLTRWSRRKMEAEREQPVPAAPDEKRALKIEPDSTVVETEEEKKQETEFDVSKLPSIESIGLDTDVRVFLQKGVPLELTRAALRRAWASDPTIRDFIGVAENQWDFATGSDIPGFGPLEDSEELRRMVADMFERPAPELKTSGSDDRIQEAESADNPETKAQWAEAPSEPETAHISSSPAPSTINEGEEGGSRDQNIAMQQSTGNSDRLLPTKRRHGSALPD